MSGQKVFVNGLNLYYEKVGQGNHVLLLCPGALGCTKTDFAHQIEKLNREQFTIIAWDPPGYGQSRPFERKHDPYYWQEDAEHAAALMEVLGYRWYSILGWSNGGRIGVIIASKYPERIRKLVIWGVSSYISFTEIELSRRFLDPAKLNKRAIAPFVEIYGQELHDKMWIDLSLTLLNMASSGQLSICAEEVENVKAETLIIHGEKDIFTPKFHSEYLHKHIKTSRLVCWEDGKHNLHIRFPERFNRLVEDVLLHRNSVVKCGL